MRKSTHPPLLYKFDQETRARIMVNHLEKQARRLQEFGYDPRPAVHWLNEILPLVRLLQYGEKNPLHEYIPNPEEELQKHWEEFVILFFDDILV